MTDAGSKEEKQGLTAPDGGMMGNNDELDEGEAYYMGIDMELVREGAIAVLMLTGIICILVFGTQHSGHGGKAALLEGCIKGNGLVAPFTPDINMQVFYGGAQTINRTAVSCGNNLLPAMFKKHVNAPLPTLGATATSRAVAATAPEGRTYYSVFMVDPDRHQSGLSGAAYLHWMLLNLNGTDPASLGPDSNCIALPAAPAPVLPTQCYHAVPYEAPTPATSVPFLHRYYFLMYRTTSPVPARTMADAAVARENFNFTQFATTYFNGKAPVGGNMFQVEYENPQGRRRLDGAMDGVAEVITGWGGGVEGEGARFWRLDGEPLFRNALGVLWPAPSDTAAEEPARRHHDPYRRTLFIDDSE